MNCLTECLQELLDKMPLSQDVQNGFVERVFETCNQMSERFLCHWLCLLYELSNNMYLFLMVCNGLYDLYLAWFV